MEKQINNNIIFGEFKRHLPLDKNFCPAVIWNQIFLKTTEDDKDSLPLSIAVIKDKDNIIVYETWILPDKPNFTSANLYYVEQIVKTLLWIYGGYKILIGGPEHIGQYIKNLYSKGGKRFFDAGIMSEIYEKPFTVEIVDIKQIPGFKKKTIPIKRSLDGCRIGFDLGASDRKVSALIDGKAIFSEEIEWNPGVEEDPSYHYNEIMSMIDSAASHLPRIDAIGGSSAGIYINNRVMKSSLFRRVPRDVFDKKVKDIFLEIQKKWKVPLVIINDGEVTALAGSMSLKKNAVLGIAMGSSEAGGYVNPAGSFNPWINELAFVPVDYNPRAVIDEWSGDIGCGVQYFSQQAVIRLAGKTGIILNPRFTPAQKLHFVQELMEKEDKRTIDIFKTIGGYLGYALAYYACFYEMETVLILGRVTSGEGGTIILKEAREVLKKEFPDLYDRIAINLPDEKSRRVGQSIAAASLPSINH